MVYQKIKQNIISNLIRLKKQHDFSHSQMGGILGISKQAYRNIEKGTTEISMKHLCEFAEYFETSVTELISKK